MRRILLFGCAIAIGAVSVNAQSDPSVGARVRVTRATNGPRLVGTVLGLTVDTLMVRECAASADVHLPMTGIASLETSAGRRIDKQRAWVGAVLGVAAGFTLGAVHGRRSDRGCPSQGSFCGVAGVVEPAAGAVLGGLAGLIPAFAFPVERWRSVMLGAAPRAGT